MNGPFQSMWNAILDLRELIFLSQAKIVVASQPLVRTKWIDGDTTTPAASANGSASLPYASMGAFLTAIGPVVSATDGAQLMTGLVSPATYTENPAVPAYRNWELRAANLLTILIGSVTWANSGGAHAPASSVSGVHNLSITGNFTYTDDAGAPSTLLSFSGDAGSPSLAGNLVATGGTKLIDIGFTLYGAQGNVTSTANASGAVVAGIDASFSGAITAQSGTFFGCALIGGGGNILTFNSGSTAAFTACTFSGGSISVGATGTIIMDGDSWVSAQENGVTTTGIVLVVGGSQGGLVVNQTSTGDASVSVSLNGTGASAGLTGGGNLYQAKTALTANRTITIKTGGGEKTGDTLDVARRGAGVSANTLSVTNNGGTETRVFAANQGGGQRWQYNTVIANDWGFVGGGGGLT